MAAVGLIGATGAMGRAIAEVLRSQGRGYRAIGRDRGGLERAFGSDPLAELRTWNPDDTASIVAALEGVESAIYLVGVSYEQFALHPVLMKATLDAARAAGVARMLLVATVYPYGLPQTPTVSESHPRNPHRFNAKMRKEQEDVLLAAHGHGIETTVLRLPDLYGPGMEKSYLTSQFTNAPSGKRSMLIGPVDARHEWAFIPDCAEVAVRVLDEPRAYGAFWNYAGPGEITQREISNKIYEACGRKPSYFVVPPLMLRAMGFFNPIMRRMSEMNYLMTNPVVMNDERLRALLGSLPKTSYDEGIARTLARA